MPHPHRELQHHLGAKDAITVLFPAWTRQPVCTRNRNCESNFVCLVKDGTTKRIFVSCNETGYRHSMRISALCIVPQKLPLFLSPESMFTQKALARTKLLTVSTIRNGLSRFPLYLRYFFYSRWDNVMKMPDWNWISITGEEGDWNVLWNEGLVVNHIGS